jgi:hypothetical protein
VALLVCSGCSTRYAPGLERCPHCGSGERVEEGGPVGSRVPFLDVACPTSGCRAAGVVRRVQLRVAALGVVEMPHLLLCTCCGTAMPAVRSWLDKEETMPKISRHGGPTNAAADAEEAAGAQVPADDRTGEEESSPGNSSSTSAEKPQTNDEPSSPAPQKRARTTASRSKRGRAASSTAAGTASSGPETRDESQDG